MIERLRLRWKTFLLLCFAASVLSILRLACMTWMSSGKTTYDLQRSKSIVSDWPFDIMICVRTSSHHKGRMKLLFETWLSSNRESTYFITDSKGDSKFSKSRDDHLIATTCESSHKRRDLCCKMEYELTFFLKSQKRWFCHVDDDTYLNVPALRKLLVSYNSRFDWYIGKPSIPKLLLKDNSTFQFATGGAGFCLSRSLVLKMTPYILNGEFVNSCDKLLLPDDCSIGYIINHLLNVKLTVISSFHSHLEELNRIKLDTLANEVLVNPLQFISEFE